MNLPKSVMIVEDEAITQRFLQEVLQRYNTTIVACVDNAQDALIKLKEIECDLILMDINIKGPIDGIQLSRRILEKQDIPIIFITAHNDDETVEETLELSPYGFICKPFTGKDIIVTLQVAYRQYLEKSKLDKVEGSKNKTKEYICIDKNYQYKSTTSQLLYREKLVDLTKNQNMLIKILVQNLNQAVGYDTLVAFVWEDMNISDSALRTLVYSLRKELPDLPLISYSKVGYALESK